MKKVAIIYGGYSEEWVISEKSAKVVLNHLDPEKYRGYLVRIAENSWTVSVNGSAVEIDKNDFSFTLGDDKTKFDVVFNAIHGTPGEDGKMQGYFDALRIPYTSPGVMASSLTFSKSYCNGFLRQFDDVNIAASMVIRKGEQFSIDEVEKRVGFPCFVKPNNGGSSFGVTKVNDASAFDSAVDHALENDTEAVVEQFINGREFGSGVYQHNGTIVPLPITEIISNNDFFDYQAKYEGASKEVTPAEIDPSLAKLMQETTAKVFARLNLRGMSRVDYIVQDGEPYLIEVNTIPGLSEESILPQQVVCAGMTLREFFGVLLEEAEYSAS